MPKTYAGKLVSKVELAVIMGVALSTLDHWIKLGAPYITQGSKGIAWVFNSADIIDWRVDAVRNQYEDKAGQENVLDYNEARRKRMQAEAELSELNLAKERQQVIAMDVIEGQLTQVFGAVKAQLLAIPHTVAHRIATQTNARTIENLLNEELNQALNELSIYDPKDLPAAMEE